MYYSELYRTILYAAAASDVLLCSVLSKHYLTLSVGSIRHKLRGNEAYVAVTAVAAVTVVTDLY
jgi:hypothetical protein